MQILVHQLSAVITPIGSSCGAIIVRASKSAKMRNDPPKSIDNGKNMAMIRTGQAVGRDVE